MFSYLQNTFDGKDAGEQVVEIFQQFISRMVFLNRIFRR